MSEEATYAASGAMSGAGAGVSTGAAVGAAIGMAGGPIGIVAGAAIGAAVGATVGAIGGFMGGKKAKKARKYAQKAAAIQQQREQEAYRQSLLAQIRQARISRASNLAAAVAAGTEESSGAQAALSSIGSQTANIVEYMSVDRGRAVQQAAYLSKAKKNAAAAQQIQSITNGIIDLGSSIASAYAATKTPTAPTVQDTGRVGYGSGNMLDSNFNIVSSNTYGGTTPYVQYKG